MALAVPADAGIRFGQYVLLRRIARGGMAEVFLAQQRGLEGFDRRVAVKRILPHLADSPDFVKMFLGEAKLAAQLAHPNIVHIYEFGKVEHDYFIAMEFVDGVHAGQLYKYGEQEKLPPTLVARIGADAANALHYAHELRSASGKLLGLVHRDVSPANIMVSYDGVVKLCDFGIAKAAATTDHLTNPGQVKGKYAYMSPEQTVAAQLDGRSDVFSLAIVLYELLSGRFIVERGDAVEAMRAIRDGRIQKLDQVAPDVPRPLAEAITWALQTQREARATAAELAQALEAFLKSAPELATSMQLGGWIRARFVREGTGQVSALTPLTSGGSPRGTQASPGTLASPGTVAAPRTAAGGTTQGPVTPQARWQVKKIADTGEGTEIYSTADLDDAETIKAYEQALRAAQEPTVRASPPVIEPTEIVRRAPDEEDSENVTLALDVHAAGPLVPSQVVSAAGSGASRVLADGGSRRRTTPLPQEMARRRRRKMLLAGAGLAGLTLVSFMIALAASSSKQPRAAAPPDAHVIAVTPIDALPIAPPPLDAATTPTVSDGDEPGKAHLVVRTIPDGGTIRVGGQTRNAVVHPSDPTGAASVELILDAGEHEVIAELPGYAREKRKVVLARGETQRIEMAFQKKLGGTTHSDVRAKTGRLTVRTIPWSDVYLGSKKLGQAPFADLEMPAGTHKLTFKNPGRPTVTKTVTIQPGKSAKLNFNLP